MSPNITKNNNTVSSSTPQLNDSTVSSNRSPNEKYSGNLNTSGNHQFLSPNTSVNISTVSSFTYSPKGSPDTPPNNQKRKDTPKINFKQLFNEEIFRVCCYLNYRPGEGSLVKEQILFDLFTNLKNIIFVDYNNFKSQYNLEFSSIFGRYQLEKFPVFNLTVKFLLIFIII